MKKKLSPIDKFVEIAALLAFGVAMLGVFLKILFF
jgi:hypothetical protein